MAESTGQNDCNCKVFLHSVQSQQPCYVHYSLLSICSCKTQCAWCDTYLVSSTEPCAEAVTGLRHLFIHLHNGRRSLAMMLTPISFGLGEAISLSMQKT